MGTPDNARLPPSAMPGQGTHAAARCQRDLYLYWRAAQAAGALALGRRGYLAVPTLRRLAEKWPLGTLASDALTSSDGARESSYPRLVFIRRLLERLDLLLPRDDGRLIAAEHGAMANYLAQPFAARIRQGTRLWLAGGWWPETIDAKRPLPSLRVPAPPRIALTRRHLLHDLLSTDPPARVKIPDLPRLVSNAANRRLSPTDSEGAVVRAALLGPLRWLGLVEFDDRVPANAEREGTESPAWCATTAAIAALNAPETAPTLEENHGRVVIQPNFEIIAYPPHTAPALAILDTCAEARGMEHAARYMLTRRGLAAARRLGWAAGAVQERLGLLSDQPLPQNIAATLADWDRQADRLVLRRGVIILEVADAALLDALTREPEGAGWVSRRLAPTVALIQEPHLAAVRGWLLRHGELPARIGAPMDAPPDEIT